MKGIIILLLLWIVAVLASAQTNTLTFTNSSGLVYTNVTVVKVEADDVLFRLEDWQYARVDYTNMPASIQTQFAAERKNVQQAQEAQAERAQQQADGITGTVQAEETLNITKSNEVTLSDLYITDQTIFFAQLDAISPKVEHGDVLSDNLQHLLVAPLPFDVFPNKIKCTGPYHRGGPWHCVPFEWKLTMSGFPVMVSEFATTPNDNGVLLFSINNTNQNGTNANSRSIIRVRISGELTTAIGLNQKWEECLNLCQTIFPNGFQKVAAELNEGMKSVANDPSHKVKTLMKSDEGFYVLYEMGYYNVPGREAIYYNINIFSPLLGRLYLPYAQEVNYW
jgi:hypothetical protein